MLALRTAPLIQHILTYYIGLFLDVPARQSVHCIPFGSLIYPKHFEKVRNVYPTAACIEVTLQPNFVH